MPYADRPLHQLSALEIKAGLSAGQLSSVELVSHLIERIKKHDSAVNSVVVICDEAMAQAEESDQRRREGKLLSPIDGIPITIKDNIDLRGYDATLGIRSRVGKPSEKDAVLVAELRRLGLVFLGKTNVPQALLAQETESPVFGVCKNPWDLSRTPGGSSGGEAAAIASGFSPWGIGTDIGGSIRIPAHFCGLVGFKPTVDRWSNRGSNSAIKGQELVRAQIGPITRSVADARLLWEHVDVDRMASADPMVPPRKSHSPKPLRDMRIGVIESDDFLLPAPSLRRAVSLTRKCLEEAGASLVPYRPTSSQEILGTWLSAISSDSGRTMRSSIGDDELSPQLKPSTALLKIPAPLRKHLGGLLSAFGESRVGMLLQIVGEKDVTELWRLTQKRSELRLKEFDLWNEHQLDAVLCPAHVVPAIPHRESGDFVLSLAAMFRWTLLNFPAGVLPVTHVVKDENSSYSDGRDRVSKKLISICQGAAGLPVGVQLVARPFAEDLLLDLMQEVETLLSKSDADVPTTPLSLR